ncbi:hypothetical protein BSKO_01996 [Bryopsis sp. KO-2023]|nr:hypothetical protein BSKO_01996 [Bryopsis sp. KO-2023]
MRSPSFEASSSSSSSESEFGDPAWEFKQGVSSGGLEVALVGIGVAAVGWLGRRLSRRSTEDAKAHEEYQELVKKVDDEFQDARETWAKPGGSEDLQSFATMRIELNLDASSDSAASVALPSPVSSPGTQQCTREIITVQPLQVEAGPQDELCLRIDPWKTRREIGGSLADILTGAALTGWCCCVGGPK